MTELYYIPYNEFQRILSLKAPAFLRTEIFASLCRINTLYMIKRAGSGHIGSSFSAMDIVSWLFLNELNISKAKEGDIFFSSKGHDIPCLYSVLLGIGTLPFEKIHTLRRLNGLPGHPDISTPGIHTNTGSLGMGISKAKGIAFANRLLQKKVKIYVMIGDGELQEGQIWESLTDAANRGLSEITIIVDHNRIQSDTWVKQVSNLGDIEAKFRAFGWHSVRCSGHNFKELELIFSELRNITDKPKVIIADTIKGKGVSFMQEIDSNTEYGIPLYRFHSGAPDSQNYQNGLKELIEKSNNLFDKAGLSAPKPAKKAMPAVTISQLNNTQKLIPKYSKELIKQAKQNPNIVALDADLILDTGLLPFKKVFPERFLECGIAEQDMVSQAGGIALKGLFPVVHSFACFLTSRPNEHIYNNATEKKRILYVGSLAGILPGGPGHSHQAVRDISTMATIPGF